MELKNSTIKDFRKKMKSITNEFEKKVGDIIIKLVGEINLFPIDLYYHRTIQLEGETFIPDYCIDIKNSNNHHIIIIELKKYATIAGIPPQLEKFYGQISKFQRDETYKEVKIHPLFVVESEDELTPDLINRAQKYDIKLFKESVFQELDDLITDINPQYGFLDFLKNRFNIMVSYEPNYIEKYAVQNKTFDVNLLTFTMTARELLKLCFVYRANMFEDNEFRYQRLIDGDRLNEIKKFIINKNFESVFPNNLVCNFADDCKCIIEDTELPNIKKVKIENKYSSLWVIDGQHRLFSLTKLKETEENLLDDFSYTVSAYKTIKKEIKQKFSFL